MFSTQSDLRLEYELLLCLWQAFRPSLAFQGLSLIALDGLWSAIPPSLLFESIQTPCARQPAQIINRELECVGQFCQQNEFRRPSFDGLQIAIQSFLNC